MSDARIAGIITLVSVGFSFLMMYLTKRRNRRRGRHREGPPSIL